MRTLRIGMAAVMLAVVVQIAGAQQVTKENVAGVTNFNKLESTIACAGATTPAAIADIKKLGYNAVINLRLPSEQGADVDGEIAAAKQANITFVNLPFNASQPDPAVVDKFIAAVTAPANQPVFVHCASANRAAALWMVKRLVVDGWDADRAGTEATALGLTSPALKQFAMDYAASHKK
ncbi:MAG: hypothetical protein LBQ09_10700 [Acidobacteriaceae bacterium]|nr:hypothetical protein [Acidobacteriaceae bacterium]